MRSYLKFIIPVVAFLAISFIYFSPQLEGKVIKTQDIIMNQGMRKEMKEFKKETGETTLWTNQTFSGMPTYLIASAFKGNLASKISGIILKIPRPASYLFLSMLLFYILLILLGASPWLGFVGALAYGFNSAFFIWIDTGHMTKALTLTFMATTVGGVLYAYKKNPLIGGILTAFSLSWMLNANHPQITYYAGLMVLILGITYLVYAIKEKTIASFAKTSVVLVVAALLAIGTNYSRLATTMEYSKYSTRGESELTDDSGNKTTGLDKDYILDYSYDVPEALSAFIPRFKGGGNMEPVGEKSHVYQLLAKQDRAYAKKIAQGLPLYWGSQPIVGAPFYFGAILIFLFVFGLFVLKGKDKWWLALTALVAFLLSLGKYFPALSHLMLDYFPGYNKFRDVKNIIVIEQFAMALMGVLAIKKVAEREISEKTFLKALKYSFAICGGLALIFAIMPGLAGDFSGAMDARMGSPELVEALKADRKMVLRADAFRSFIFVALAAATLWAFWTKKLKAQYALGLWAVLIFADMWPVNKKYLNNDDFESKRKSQVLVQKTKADESILQDKDPNYKVLNLTVNPFSDGTTSFYHKSVGGYHGAKLGKYQELIEHGISPEISKMQQGFRNIKTQSDIDNMFAQLDVLNMLNVKYIIHNTEYPALQNRKAMGNAWFVPTFRMVENADAEIAAIQNFDVQKEAIVDQRFLKYVEGKTFGTDSTASITLTKYAPNALEYQSNASKEQLAVFSEIYYPAGWKAFIDGEEVPHFRVNYVLRSMVVPAGKHTIEFKFHPETYYAGNRISLISSILLFLALGGVIILEIRKKKLNKSA